MSEVVSVEEGRLRLDFDSGSWLVIKYDDEPAYRDNIHKLGATKAVDLIGLYDSELYFVELKDFRGYRIENKQRIADGDLAQEVAQKVRDTIAGLIGLHRCRQDPDVPWPAFVQGLQSGRRMHVVLWLAEDHTAHRQDIRRPGRQATLLKVLKARLRWLNTKVLVESPLETRLEDVKVSNLPDTDD